MMPLSRWSKVALILLAVPGFLISARLGTQGAPIVNGSREPDEPKPQEPAAKKANPHAAFLRRYNLALGEDIKRVAPPFDSSRIEYYDSLFRGPRDHLAAHDVKVLLFKQRDKTLAHPTASFGGGDRYGTTLSTLLTSLVGIYPQEVEGKHELLETFVEGDFVAREGVPTEQLVKQLERILRDECKLTLKLNLREVDRTVIVASGSYHFRPARSGRQTIEIYGETLVTDGTGGGGSGDLDEMFRWVGRFTEPNTRIVNEIKDPPKEHVSWHLNTRSPFTKEIAQEDRDIALVFEHLVDQTGLTFKHEERKVRVLTVEHPVVLSRAPRFTLTDHKDVAWCATFAPNGKSLVTCSGNRDATAGEVRGYDLSARKPVPIFLAEQPHGIRWVTFAPDGKTLASAEYDRTARIRDATTGKILKTLDAHRNGVQCVKFSRDGKLLVTCGKDGTAKAWNLEAMKPMATMTGHNDHVYSLDLSPDNKTLATASNDATAAVWDVLTGKQKGTIPGHRRSVEVVRFSPDGQSIASGGWDGIVNIWGSATETHVQALGGPGGGILSLAFSPDGQYLVAGTDEGLLRLWDAKTWRALDSFAPHAANLRAIAFSSDGKLMATASFDKTVKLWDAPQMAWTTQVAEPGPGVSR